ncbi:alpha/beta fold hydrolase [Rhodococcus opacus]|uniref:alpha/beta fold hydrolase n=1 Tax=Rhodococcus opacus TaxID=37919 RepID=UPI000EA9376C|nr:alpha/beta hydrolase [Rhodococcus opacus]QZS52555.1 alpha/beta hydrolase [Rhodococcus opacus]RKM64897.1 alpha/beta hydrolase [Rhodococcus opacus]
MTSPTIQRGDERYRSNDVETQYIEVDEVRYAYRELGAADGSNGIPLVFLHRFRGTLDDWDPEFVDAVAEHRHVILFSDAAVGSSTGAAATTVNGKAENAAAFIRALGYSAVDVLGFSMGGFVAQALALDEPDLVRSAVLVGSGPGGNAETDPHTDLVFGIALKPEYALEDVRYLFFAEGREAETQAYMDRNAERGDREPLVVPETIQAMAGLIMDFMSGKTGHYERLGQLSQPVLIVSGDSDNFFPAKNQWLLYRELPNAQLAIYPQAGHGPHQQHPHEVASQVHRFLDVQDRAQA